MKKLTLFVLFILLASGASFSQTKLDPAAMKNLHGQNVQQGKPPYHNIEAVHVLKISGLDADEKARKFDAALLKDKRVIKCVTDVKSNATYITTAHDVKLEDLKHIIYAQGHHEIINHSPSKKVVLAHPNMQSIFFALASSLPTQKKRSVKLEAKPSGHYHLQRRWVFKLN